MAKTQLERKRDHEFRTDVRKKVRNNSIAIIFLSIVVLALAVTRLASIF